jgi:penicillin-binding protein 2
LNRRPNNTHVLGLEHGVKSSDIFTCTGTYQVPGEDHKRIDDKPTGHGGLTAPDALGPSCDVIFWNVAVILNQKDPNVLPSVAKAFGYGEPTGIVGVPDGADAGGLVPDPQWLQQNKHYRLNLTDAANLGIGQGFFSATPAQVLVSGAGQQRHPHAAALRLRAHSPPGTVVRRLPAEAALAAPLRRITRRQRGYAGWLHAHRHRCTIRSKMPPAGGRPARWNRGRPTHTRGTPRTRRPAR